MKILVSVLTCFNTQAQANACLNTWIKYIKSPHKYFFYGDSIQSKSMKNTWDCSPGLGEDRSRLPEKTYKMLKQSLSHDWDFLFKCDDDTFVNFKLLEGYLKNFNPQDDLYIGKRKIFKGLPYAQGGSGYILSRSAIQKAWNHLDFYLHKEGGEDIGVAASMRDVGIQIIDNIQLNEGLWIPFADRSSDLNWAHQSDGFAKKQLLNGKISSHYLSPICMHETYALLEGGAKF